MTSAATGRRHCTGYTDEGTTRRSWSLTADMSEAHRQVPVHPRDWHLLARQEKTSAVGRPAQYLSGSGAHTCQSGKGTTATLKRGVARTVTRSSSSFCCVPPQCSTVLERKPLAGNRDSVLEFLLAAEPVVGSSSCHRARAGDQGSCRENLTKSRVGEIGCGMRAVPWSPDGSDNAFDVSSRHGEARGGGAPLFGRSAD